MGQQFESVAIVLERELGPLLVHLVEDLLRREGGGGDTEEERVREG